MVKFEIQCEDDNNDERIVRKTLVVMEAVIELNQIWLKRYPADACFLTCDDVKYDFEMEYALSKTIDIKTIPVIKMKGRGLCIDFVCFDVAIRRMMGEKAIPEILEGDRPGVFHIRTVVLENGGEKVYDPSREVAQYGAYHSAPSACSC
jgi:hypothetical protein